MFGRLKTSILLLLLLATLAMHAQSNAVTTTDSAEVKTFQAIEDNWSMSVNNRDQYGLELVLSPLFVDISATGEITTRNQQITALISGEDKTLHIDQKVITVRMLGDIAVANGTYALHRRVNGNPVDEKGVYTHVYERLRNGWVCVNAQRTLIRESGPAKAGKPEKKGSGAELPFHVPLFGK